MLEDAGIPLTLEVFPSLSEALPTLYSHRASPLLVLLGDLEYDVSRIATIHHIQGLCPHASITVLMSFMIGAEMELLKKTFPAIPCWEKTALGVQGFEPVLRHLARLSGVRHEGPPPP